MKKVLAIVLAVAVLAMGLIGASVAQAVATTIDKDMASGDFDLGDHISVTLDVTVAEAPATVVDILPEGLSYIPGTFEVNAVAKVPDVAGQVISYQLTAVGPYTITFDVQVTSVEAEEVEDLTNRAEVRDALGALLDYSEVDDIDLLPYDCFYKVIAVGDTDVPVETDVSWTLWLDVGNCPDDEIDVMENVVVKDNLGGDLEVDGWYIGETTDSLPGATIKVKGKTEKAQLKWVVGTLTNGQWSNSDLVISTDVNTGRGTANNPGNSGNNQKDGYQEYTDEECSEHDLNSGATLKFIDAGEGGTGLQLSAHTLPITVMAHVDPHTCD